MGGLSAPDGRVDIPQSEIANPQSVSWPVMQLHELLQRLDPPLPRPPDQGPQDVSGGEGIPKGAMSRRVLDAEERCHMVESTVTQLRHEPASEANRAEGPAAGRGDPGQGVFGREEAPVESGVVGDEHPGIERACETGDNVLEARPTGDQAVGDAGEARHPRGNWSPRVEQCFEGEVDGSALEDRHRHLEDPSAV